MESVLKSKKVRVFVAPIKGGKDTSAEIFRNEISNEKYVNISFADPLKKMMMHVFGLTPFDVYTQEGKEKRFKYPLKFSNGLISCLIEEMKTYLPDEDYSKVDYAKILKMEFSSPRDLLQVVGTEIIRNMVSSSWHPRAAFTSTKVLSSLADAHITCTDCRFPNEFDFLAENFLDFKVCYIERAEAEERLAKATHPSETSISIVKEKIKKLDPSKARIIDNNGTLAQLKEKLYFCA